MTAFATYREKLEACRLELDVIEQGLDAMEHAEPARVTWAAVGDLGRLHEALAEAADVVADRREVIG